LKTLQIPKVEAKDEDTPIPNQLSKEGNSRDKEPSIVVEQDNPNSPLYSVKSFEELNLSKELLKGIYEMGFNRPSKIQEAALPIICGNPPKI